MKYDRIHFTNGSSEDCFNISRSVGYKGANLLEDVMLVQAMLKLIASYSRNAAGLDDPNYNIPEITGSIDADTYSAIGQFQLAHRNQLLTFDDRIDPAHYKGRRISKSGRRFMTITLLHFYAVDAALMIGKSQSEFVLYQPALESLDARMVSLFDAALMKV